jgi:hypothetical protein
MTEHEHIWLLIKYQRGQPLKEPVHAESVGNGVYRLLYTPGLVQGIAAGDEFRLVGDDGAFSVHRRGGNLAVKVLSMQGVGPLKSELATRVASVGGWLDGAIDKALAFTVPVAVGFPAVEAIFNNWVAEHPGWEWYYDNVYDPVDGVTPLGWWA